jgi:hypothetical protein
LGSKHGSSEAKFWIHLTKIQSKGQNNVST